MAPNSPPAHDTHTTHTLLRQAHEQLRAKNYVLACTLLLQASALGSPHAMYRLAAAYEHGIGVQKNMQKSMWWYGRAGSCAHKGALERLGKYAANGSPDAQMQMGYVMDLAGNDRGAFRMFALAAKQGLTTAITNLAVFYADGRGVDRNVRHAIYLLKETVLRGDAVGMYNLALIYEDGKGSLSNLEQARKHYRMAGGKGHLKSQAAFERLCTTMNV